MLLRQRAQSPQTACVSSHHQYIDHNLHGLKCKATIFILLKFPSNIRKYSIDKNNTGEQYLCSSISKCNSSSFMQFLSLLSNSSELSLEHSQVLRVMLLQASLHIIFYLYFSFSEEAQGKKEKIMCGKLLYMGEGGVVVLRLQLT